MNCAENVLRVPLCLCDRLIAEYKRVLFQMDEDLERVVAIVKAYQARYGKLE